MELMKELSLTPGVSGSEEKIAEIIERELKDTVDSIERDTMGNLIATKKGEKKAPTIMLASHMDEIGLMVSYIDDKGIVKAYYSNGDTYNFAKLALVGFTAPENLTPYEGTLFQANTETGESFYSNENSNIVSGSLENSTVNIEEEFSTMILVQRAYSSSANAFTTTDEMLQTAVNLKT